jgi:hypothetical protein
VLLQGPEIEKRKTLLQIRSTEEKQISSREHGEIHATQRPKPGAKMEFFRGNGNSSNHQKTNISMVKIKAGLQSQRRQLENGSDRKVAPETRLISGAE